MRLCITLHANNLNLPINNAHGIQAAIYNNLSKDLAERIHDCTKEERYLKYFVFSKLEGKYELDDKHNIIFNGPVRLLIASLNSAFLKDLYMHLSKAGIIQLYKYTVPIENIELLNNDIDSYIMKYKTVSPVTLFTSNKDYTNYYSPFDGKYEEILLETLNNKLRSLGMEEDHMFHIVGFSNIQKRVVKYQNNTYEAYDYNITIEASELLHNLMLDTGVGLRNPIGFGMIEKSAQ